MAVEKHHIYITAQQYENPLLPSSLQTLMEILERRNAFFSSTGYSNTMYFITDYLSTMVKWIAWDIIDIFKVLSLHGKLKEIEVIWPFATQPLLPLVSSFRAMALLTFYYISDITLVFGQEEVLFLRAS